MLFTRRRKIAEFDPTGTTEKELYQGAPIQFLFFDCNGAGGTSLTFSIEIDGVQVYNGTLLQLNEENALLYGFSSSFGSGQNILVGLLELESIISSRQRSRKPVKSVEFKYVSGDFDALNITVGELIDIK